MVVVSLTHSHFHSEFCLKCQLKCLDTIQKTLMCQLMDTRQSLYLWCHMIGVLIYVLSIILILKKTLYKYFSEEVVFYTVDLMKLFITNLLFRFKCLLKETDYNFSSSTLFKLLVMWLITTNNHLSYQKNKKIKQQFDKYKDKVK